MGRRARLKSERRQARKQALPPCSYKNCAGRPESTHIIQKKDGTFFAACEDCVDPMMQALRLAGIDAQVITHAALAMMSRGAKRRKALTVASSSAILESAKGQEGAVTKKWTERDEALFDEAVVSEHTRVMAEVAAEVAVRVSVTDANGNVHGTVLKKSAGSDGAYEAREWANSHVAPVREIRVNGAVLDPECPRCGGPATPAGRGVMHDTPCPHSSHDDPVK